MDENCKQKWCFCGATDFKVNYV